MQPFLGRRVNVVDARDIRTDTADVYTYGGWFRRAVVIRYGVVGGDDKKTCVYVIRSMSI